jgi:hypothetical protein
MKRLRITGRCDVMPPPADWREQLATLAGGRPRRISLWTELGLYGALRCMAQAGEARLPPGAALWLGSRRGTHVATASVIAQSRDELPMPLSFLQTQPSQSLAILGAQLGWVGSACFVAGGSPPALLQLATARMAEAGVLLGWVDDMDGGSSHWLRLCPEAGDGGRAASEPSAVRPMVDGIWSDLGAGRVKC